MRCWLPVGSGPDTAHSPLDELGPLDAEPHHLADDGDDLSESTDHFKPHLLNECCESISVEAGSDNAEFGHVGC